MDVVIKLIGFIVVIIVAWLIYEYVYFRSQKFCEIKESIKDHIDDCNDLNEHIEELKNTYVNFKHTDFGQGDFIDTSAYDFKRPELKQLRETENTYDCSLTVCRGARQQPFKYLCKYFNIKADEESLSIFEQVLNNFSAAEQGKVLLENQRVEILESIEDKIPFLIRKISKKKLIKNLGFEEVNFKELYFPKYSFRYVSSAGNSSQLFEVTLDIENLDRFVNYLASLVKFRKSVAGQRALMTTALREKIKNRDKFTCRLCRLSTKKEPNLLLEIDHIVPLAKNGLTSEDNLQTLCWRCNRSKGAK